MVKMQYTMAGTFNGRTFAEYKKTGYGFSSGGFEFVCNIHGREVSVPFDWASMEATVNADGTMTVYHGEKNIFGGEPELDDIFEDDWKALGITQNDLTARTLARTTEIREFHLDYEMGDKSEDDVITLLNVTLIDENDSYEVSKEVLRKAGNILEL